VWQKYNKFPYCLKPLHVSGDKQALAFKMNIKFPIRLWLLSIVLGPIMMFAWGLWVSNFRWVLDDLTMLLIFLFVGALLSTPALAICYFTYTLLALKGFSKHKLELVSCLISLLMVWGTFLTLFGMESFKWSGNRSGLIYSSIYSASIILSATGIWFVRSRRPILQDVTPKEART
jgi:hypothetical protein